MRLFSMGAPPGPAPFAMLTVCGITGVERPRSHLPEHRQPWMSAYGSLLAHGLLPEVGKHKRDTGIRNHLTGA